MGDDTEDDDMLSKFRPVPDRLLRDPRFIRLGRTDPLAERLLMRLYLACDRRGRGCFDGAIMRAKTVLLDLTDDEVEAAGARLASPEIGLLHVYPDRLNGGRAWQIDRYWDDLTEDMRRKAGASMFPAPPEVAADLPELVAEPSAPQGRPYGAVTAPVDVDPDERQQTGDTYARTPRARTWDELNPTAPGSWPSPQHESSGRQWIGALHRLCNPMHGQAMVTADAVASIARMHAEYFLAAVASAIKADASWGGWRARYPLNWLREQCEIEQRKALAPKPSSAPSRPERKVPAPHKRVVVEEDLT